MDLPIPTEKLYDLTFLEEMDDKQYLLEMLNLLVTEIPMDLTAMKEGAEAGDYKTVANKAHILKSTAGIIAVTKFVAILVTIETAVKAEVDSQKLVSHVANASQIFAQVEKGLRESIALLQ